MRQLAAQSAQFTEQAKTWLSTIDTFNNNVKVKANLCRVLAVMSS